MISRCRCIVDSVYYLDDHHIRNLFEKFSVSPIRSVAERKLHLGVEDDSATVQFPVPSRELIEALKKYAAIRSRYDIDSPQAFSSDYDRSLNDSTSKWLHDNDLLALFPLFWYYGTTFGYGHPNDIAAIYFLKLLGADLLVALEEIKEPVFGVQFAQFQALLKAMASSLDGPIFLNTIVENVSYESNFNVITYRVEGGQRQEMTCGSIVIAFAPTADAMRLFMPPNNETELASLFEEVKTTPYYTILYKDENGDFASGASVSYRVPKISGIPDNPAENLLYIKQQPVPRSSVVAYYSSPTLKTEKEAKEESMIGYSFKIGRPVTEDIIEDFNYWQDYFPHVSKESLDAGFYHRFDEMQGHHHQWYVGGLFNFESVQQSMVHSKWTMEKLFVHNAKVFEMY